MGSSQSESSQIDSVVSDIRISLGPTSTRNKRFRTSTSKEDKTSPSSKRRSTQSRHREYSHTRNPSNSSDTIGSVHTASVLSGTEAGVVRTTSAHHNGATDLSDAQRNLIQTWYHDFAHFDATPQSPEDAIRALAVLLHAPTDTIDDFIEELRSIAINTGQSPPKQRPGNIFPSYGNRQQDPRSLSSLAQTNTHLPTPILALVQRYINSCRRQRSRTDGRRTVNKGHLRCTFGCGYRTARVFDWRRHEETHEPQELWLCNICYGVNTDNPFMVNRKDKFLRHVKESHKEEEADKMLQESKVKFTPRGGLKCGDCGDECGNWEDRCRHMLTHFEQEQEERGNQRSGLGGGRKNEKKRETESISDVSNRNSEEE